MRVALLYKQLTSLTGLKKAVAKPLVLEIMTDSMKASAIRMFAEVNLIDQPWVEIHLAGVA